MSADLPDRLRAIVSDLATVGDRANESVRQFWDGHARAIAEAADEIDNLRAEVKILRGLMLLGDAPPPSGEEREAIIKDMYS